MNSTAQIEQFRRDGFVVGGLALLAGEVAVLRDELERTARDRWPERPVPPVWRCLNLWQMNASYARLIRHPLIVSQVAALSGATALRLWHDDVRRVTGDESEGSAWRQEGLEWSVLEPMSQVSAWVAMDQGVCVNVVPGSHRWGPIKLSTERTLPAKVGDWTLRQQTITLSPGHAFYIHPMTLLSIEQRPSPGSASCVAGLHYMSEKTHYVVAGTHRLKPLIEVDDGEVITGRQFPLVWTKNRLR